MEAQGTQEVHKGLTIAVVALGALMTALDTTVVNVALPVIRQDFGFLKVSVSDLQWVVNAYALAYAACLLPAGKLGDVYGRRRVFLIGLVLFVGASIGCGAANGINTLIAVRAVQGVGAALITPSSLSILTATFDPEERGLALGLWSAVLGIGIAMGPLVGGALISYASWRWIFFINVPIGIVCFAATLAWVAESRDPTAERRIDIPGVLTSTLALLALTFGLLKGNDYGWSDPRTIALLAVGVGGLVAFVFVERVQAHPMLPLSLFRSATFAGANAVAVFAGFVLFGALFFDSLLLQTIMGYSALKTGVALLPMMLMIMATSPQAGRLVSKGVSPRWLIAAGMVLLADGFVLLSRLGFGSAYYNLLPPFLLGGVGLALVLTPLTAAALAGVPVRHAGIASGVINTTRQVGGTLGLAVLVTISSSIVNSWLASGRTRADGFAHSVDEAMLTMAGVALAGAVVAATTLARRSPVEEADTGGPLELARTGAWAIATPAVRPIPRIAAGDGAFAAVEPRGRPGPARLALAVEAGPAAGERIPIGEELIVGRAEPGPGRLNGDPEVSRRHASFSELEPTEVLVEDLASTNGTFVNGRRILAPTVAVPGDEIRTGTTVMRVEADGVGSGAMS
jgi:EmrB/QacA subfamily drug resistance transporter